MKSLLFILVLAAGCGAAEGLTREYIFIRSHYSWYHAQSYCRQYYRDLATITSNEENQRLLQENYPHGWVGQRMSSPSTWSDGEPFLALNWNINLNHCDLETHDCCLGAYYRNWYRLRCDYGVSFYCYRFLILVKENKTWEEALEFCRTHYTGLASVTSEWSLKQLKLETVETETESVWTGLRFMDGQWFWVNKEQPGIPLGSLVSMPSCPDPSYRCGALNTTTNTLNNHNCNEKMNFVCYWA